MRRAEFFSFLRGAKRKEFGNLSDEKIERASLYLYYGNNCDLKSASNPLIHEVWHQIAKLALSFSFSKLCIMWKI